MNKGQTDNSFLSYKIKLRIDNLPIKKQINVLDCFSGNSLIWNKIKEIKKDKIFNITSMDSKDIKNKIYLKGNNIKYLIRFNIDNYDIIDLDSYGIPFKQLEVLKIKDGFLNKTIFITFIQSIFGKLNTKLLIYYGYKKKMIEKCPSLFNNKGFEIFKNYLAGIGFKKIYYYNINRKYYICLKGE